MSTDFELPPVKHISPQRRIEVRCARGYVYVPHEDPVKEEAQFYEDYIKAVELEFGENSKELREFEVLYEHCKEHRITIYGFKMTVEWLFKDHGGLYLKFFNTVLPYLYPLATEEEADRANQFLQTVKAAFPGNKRRCYEIEILILRFQSGIFTLKEMTVKMLELLEKRVELVEAYFQFVPQAQNIRNTASLPPRYIVPNSTTQMMPPAPLEITFVPLKRRVDARGTGDFEYIPTKNPVKDIISFYKAFVKSVEREYGEHSKEVNAFGKWYRDCKECRITVDEFKVKIMWLLKSKPELVFMLYNTVLPFLYPLSTKKEVARANQFIQRVKSAFPNNKELCASVCLSVFWFQEGKATLEQMTAEVLQVLGNRDDLIEAYMEFVPRAQNCKAYMEFVPRAQNFKSRAKFLFYPVIGGFFLASAIVLYKLAFPNNRNLCAGVCVSVMRYQGGDATLKQMTEEVLELLGNRDDLIKAYIKFVPQAQNSISTGKFLSYPVIAGLLVASAFGLSKMMK